MRSVGMTVCVIASVAVSAARGDEKPRATEPDGKWVTLKGQIVLPVDRAVPERKPLNVDKDKEACLKDGPVLGDDWVVNPKNRGIANAFVWLAPVEKAGKLSVHPTLNEPPKKPVEIEIPCCAFVPHVVALREGQTLLVRNKSTVGHIALRHGTRTNPERALFADDLSSNPQKFSGLKADPQPLMLVCAIHPWMKGYFRIFDHPYFAVTDTDGQFEMPLAPVGKCRLIIWHEDNGYRGGVAGKNGEAITIEPGKADLGKIELKLSE